VLESQETINIESFHKGRNHEEILKGARIVKKIYPSEATRYAGKAIGRYNALSRNFPMKTNDFIIY